MKFKILRTSLLLSYITLSSCLKTRPKCYGADRFYDSVTGGCSPCSDICDNSNIQRTEEFCYQECPSYKSEKSTNVVPTRHDVAVIPLWLIALIIAGIVLLVIAGYGCYKLVQKYQPPARDGTWLCRLAFLIRTILHLETRILDDADVALGVPVEQEPEVIPRRHPFQQPDDDNSTEVIVPSGAPINADI